MAAFHLLGTNRSNYRYIPRTYVVYVREHFTSASAGSRVQVIQPQRKKYKRLQTSYVIIANSKMFMHMQVSAIARKSFDMVMKEALSSFGII